MAATSIRIVDFMSEDAFSDNLSRFAAEDYNNDQVCGFPNSPYDYLLECADRSVMHFKAYGEIMLADAVSKGCDPESIACQITFAGEYVGGLNLEQTDDPEAGICIERDGVLLLLRLPEKYSIENGGIREFNGKAFVEICSHLILPIAIYRNAEKETEQLEIAYNHDGEWHHRIVAKETAYKATGMMGLANYGVYVNSATAKKLSIFLQATEQLNRQNLPLLSVSDHLGWNEDYTAFVPYTADIHYTNEGSFFKEFQSVQSQKGTLEEWLKLMKPIRDAGHVQERIAMAAAFASVLIKPSSSSPFMLDIWGGAGIGKTTILIAAASIWGDPQMPGGYIGTFNASDVANEQLAMFCSDLPLLLDEMQTIQNQRNFETIVYKLCEGKPRGRATSTGALREQGTWHNTILVTGEEPIVGANSMGGARRRVVNLKCDKPLFCGDKAVIGELRTNINNCYGSAGRAFIENLMIPNNMQRALALLEENKAAFARAADGAQNLPGALILTADTLATEWIYQDGVTLSLEEVAEYLRSDQEIDSSARAHEYLMQWIIRNQNHIMPIKQGTGEFTATPYGRYVKRSGRLACAILPSVFAKLMKDGGFSDEAYMEWAARNEKISTDGTRHRTVNVRFKIEGEDRQIRCVCVYVKDEDTTEE